MPYDRSELYYRYRAMEMFPARFSSKESIEALTADQWAEVLAYILIRDGEKAEEIHSLRISNLQGAIS